MFAFSEKVWPHDVLFAGYRTQSISFNRKFAFLRSLSSGSPKAAIISADNLCIENKKIGFQEKIADDLLVY